MKSDNRAAFSLVEIMVVIAIISVLAGIAIPNYIQARAFSQSSACIANLRMIDSVIQQWAIETKQSPNEPLAGHESELAPYMRDKVFPTCPAGNLVYTLGGTVNEPFLKCPNEDKPKTGMHRLPSH